MTDFAVKIVLAYLLGSIVGSLVVGKLRGGVDVRKLGSGNAGATNALRTQGPAFAFWVFLIDLAKGFIAARILAYVALPGIAPTDVPDVWILAAACAFAAILGHVFPVWHGFRGGKGVATLIGAFAGLDPWLLLPLFGTWLAIVMISGFVGLASIAAALAVPIYLLIRHGAAASATAEFWFSVACALLVIFTHRGNVRRMREGTEPRSAKLWVFGRGRT
jgi:acyl phosphate:glycerol-3-phosphate acyltransferase